jgi:hypothetical protein
MNPPLRLLGAAASRGLLTGQIIFSTAFVGACELPNWIHAPRQVNACLERWMTVSALFFPSGMQTAAANNQVAPWLPAGGGCSDEQLHSCFGLRRALRSGAGPPQGVAAGSAGAPCGP